MQQAAVCSLCSESPDSRNHLFFNCAFSARVLQHFQNRGYNSQFHGSWDDFTRDVSGQWRAKSLHNLINKLVLAAMIFHIWQERNRRLFQSKGKRYSQIVSDVEDDIHKKLLGLSVAKTPRVRDELLAWGIDMELASTQN